MKLRMITGSMKALDQAVLHDDSLPTRIKTDKLVVQADGQVLSIPLVDGRTAFVAGEIVGIRTADDQYRSGSASSLEVKHILQTESIESCRDILEGRFLLAVAASDGTCVLCADRFGQMDLYCQDLDQAIVFANDLSLLIEPPAKGGYDQVGIAYALTVYGTRPPKRQTFYKNVRRLGVGDTVHLSQGRAEVRPSSFTPLRTARYDERDLHRYSELLLDAVRIRGSRHGNVVSLSSGWDSTGILACLVHLYGASKVRAVTGRMVYAERSGVINQFEIDRARAIAAYYGVPLDIVDYDYRDRGPEWADKMAPLLKSNSIYSFPSIGQSILYDHVARTSKGGESLFVGEISDGVHNLGFSQYATLFHPDLGFREYGDKMSSYLFGPTFLRLFQGDRFMEDPVYDLFRRRAGTAIFEEPSTEGPSGRTRQLLASFFLRSNRLPLWSLKNNKMLKQEFIPQYSREIESSYLQRASEEATLDTLYSWYLYLYNSFHWQSSMIAGRSLIAESYGLKLALPFWDSRLQDYLSAMPECWGRGLDLNPTKYPLKWMLKNKIDYPIHLQTGPHSYLYDIDPSFSHTAEVVYGSAFSGYFKGLLRSRDYEDLLDPQVFDLGYIDGLFKRFLAGEEKRGAELADLFSLCTLMMLGWYGQRGSK